MRFVGTCFRAHDPRWSFLPHSGEGAAVHGGRFNRKGVAALYLSLTPEGAMIEASGSFEARMEPMTLCSYDVDCDDILDLTDAAVLRKLAVTSVLLSSPWRMELSDGLAPQTWQLADRLMAQGHSGIVVPSFASRATPDMKNLVLWRWGPDLPHKVSVYDPSGRLPANQLSWPSP